MIRHSKPYFEKKDFDFIKTILSTKMIASSKGVKRFEERFSNLISKRYSVAVNSATNALFLSLLYFKEKNNYDGYVLIPSFTCVSVLNAVLMAGLKPVLCDVNKVDFLYNISLAKEMIRRYNIKIVIVPYLFGYPSECVLEFKKMNLFVVEDIAQALGAKVSNQLVGSFGDISVSSFYATKMMTTLGEGGIISANNKECYDYLRDLIEYDKKDSFRLRYSFKMTEAQAFFGLSQLYRLNFFIKRRLHIAKIYSKALAGKKGLRLHFNTADNLKCVFYRYIVELVDYSRDDVIKRFRDFGIEVCSLYKPLNLYYKAEGEFKVSVDIFNNFISIPIYPALSEDEIFRILKAFDRIFK